MVMVVLSLVPMVGAASCDDVAKRYAEMSRHADLFADIRSSVHMPANGWRKGDFEACSILSFDLDRDGKASNVEVVESSPSRVYGQAARSALKGFVFRSASGGRYVLLFHTYRFDPSNS